MEISYYPGGYDPDAPAHNRHYMWDLASDQYTEWDTDGSILEQRPLTDDEKARLQPDPGF